VTQMPPLSLKISLYSSDGRRLDTFTAAVPFALRELEDRLLADWPIQPGDTVQIERVAG
jgi:hypothetical protein